MLTGSRVVPRGRADRHYDATHIAIFTISEVVQIICPLSLPKLLLYMLNQTEIS